MRRAKNPYRGFRFPPEIIARAVWLYHCFSLSLRDVELILVARGVIISYESTREWGIRFGRQFATSLKRRRSKPGDKWHLDELIMRVRGKIHCLWRAVDQNGVALDILVQNHPDADAAKRFFRKLLTGWTEAPHVIVTDKRKRCAAAKRQILPKVAHRQSRYLNNRGRSIAPADMATRAADAAVQIDTTSAAFPIRPQPLFLRRAVSKATSIEANERKIACITIRRRH